MISNNPATLLPVRVSPNTATPKNTAVTGSSAPNMAVAVDPTYTIAFVAHNIDITVGRRAKASKSPHRYHFVGV